MDNSQFMKLALRTLERKLKRRISAVIPTEIGGGNTAVALHVAAISALPVIDGDQTGRSAPELVHSSYHLKGIPATPSVIVDSSGKMIVIENCRNSADYERIVRDFAVRAGGTVFAIDSPLEAKKIQSCAIMNSVSKAIKLGEVLEKARVKKGDPVQATVNFLKGFRLIDGYVQDFNLTEKKGFLTGEVRLKGRCVWRGHSFLVWVKNENIIGRRDEKVVAMAPDLICVLDEDGNGVTNSELRRGMKATVIAVRANRIWRTKRGVELFGPRHFGFDFDYVPVEKRFR